MEPMAIQRVSGFMLVVDEKPLGLVGSTLEDAQRAAAPHLTKPKAVRLEEYPGEIRPMRVWYYDYDIKGWVQGG